MGFFNDWRSTYTIEMGTIQDKRLASEHDSASLLTKKVSNRASVVPDFPRDFLVEQTKPINAFVAARGSPQQASMIANAQQQFSPSPSDDDTESERSRSSSPEKPRKMAVFSPRSWGFARTFSMK